MMKNITDKLEAIYLPKKALVIYESANEREGVYVEAYDMDKRGNPVNAHPLSVQETIALADCLNSAREVRTDYLGCEGLLPERLLHVNTYRGCAVWHTPPQQVNLLFTENLGIPCGMAAVPALLWKADRNKLSLFALNTKGKPKAETTLYRAPFFNVYEDGEVCMGTVDTDFTDTENITEFMERWEQAFWNSYFSHLNGDSSPVRGNIVQLWQGLVGTDKKFPNEVLIKQGKTIKDILS